MCYSAFAEQGLYTMEELRTYNADGTEVDMSPCEGRRGFVITMGSLGQGPSQAAGIAYGERVRGSDKRVYCLLSDGELQEGNVWEAAMFAGHHKLDNLVLLIDNNDLQAGGHTRNILSVEPVPEKFEAFGFKARRVNGNSIPEILDAFEEARATKNKPYAMVCDTRLFHGNPYMQTRFPTAHYVQADMETWKAALAELDGFIAAGGADAR
jgi:transketolase